MVSHNRLASPDQIDTYHVESDRTIRPTVLSRQLTRQRDEFPLLLRVDMDLRPRAHVGRLVSRDLPRFHFNDDNRPPVRGEHDQIDLAISVTQVRRQNAITCFAKETFGDTFATCAG